MHYPVFIEFIYATLLGLVSVVIAHLAIVKGNDRLVTKFKKSSTSGVSASIFSKTAGMVFCAMSCAVKLTLSNLNYDNN